MYDTKRHRAVNNNDGFTVLTYGKQLGYFNSQSLLTYKIQEQPEILPSKLSTSN